MASAKLWNSGGPNSMRYAPTRSMMAASTGSDFFKWLIALRMQILDEDRAPEDSRTCGLQSSVFSRQEKLDWDTGLRRARVVLKTEDRRLLRKILQGRLNQPSCSGVRIARVIPLHGTVPFITVLFHEAECLGHIHTHSYALAVGLGRLHVRDAISMAKHRIDAAVRIVGILGSEGVAEIRQGAQPRTVHLLDQLHQEEWIFADRVVILEIDDNILRRRMLDHAQQAVSRAIEVRLHIFCRRKIGANARRAQGDGSIHPQLAEGNSLLPFGTVGRIGAMFAVHRNVHDRCPRTFDSRPELLQIFRIMFRIAGRKMSGPGLDLVDPKFFDHVGCKVFEIDRRIAWFVVRAGDELSERIGSNRDSLPRLGGKVQAGRGTGRG